MRKSEIEIRILKIAITIFAIIAIIFLSLISIDYSWILGWVMSSTVSLISYLIGLLMIKKIFKKKSKKKGWILTFIRIAISYFLHTSFIIIVIFVDKTYHHKGFLDKGSWLLFEPINIFTYLGGISLIAFSTFVANIHFRKDGKHEQNKR